MTSQFKIHPLKTRVEASNEIQWLMRKWVSRPSEFWCISFHFIWSLKKYSIKRNSTHKNIVVYSIKWKPQRKSLCILLKNLKATASSKLDHKLWVRVRCRSDLLILVYILFAHIILYISNIDKITLRNVHNRWTLF